MTGRMMKVREPAETAAALEANRQRSRLDARAKLIPRRDTLTGVRADGVAVSGPAERICVVVGGRGAFRRLSDMLAPLIGDAVVEAGDPIETVDAIRAAALGRFPRVVLLCPSKLSEPIVSELVGRTKRYGLGWPLPTDLLGGLRSRDREAFLRRAIRIARGET